MNFRQLIEVRSLLSVVRCQLKKIRVNSRDTWKGFVFFATLREESQTPKNQTLKLVFESPKLVSKIFRLLILTVSVIGTANIS